MKKTNTFIIGAPKCGTTALCHYLQQHPNVFVCEPKEPHYFARLDMPNRNQYVKDEDTYTELFTSSTNQHKILVDGSVWHLYCKNAVRLIAEYNKDAKIIIMLRRPDEMAYSFHSQALQSFDEDVIEFSTAWKMATGEIKREQIPKHCYAPKVLMYDKIACYGTQLENVYKHFPKEQVQIVFFEDFRKNTETCYTSVLTFLEIEHSNLVSFDKINENAVIRNRVIGQFLAHPPKLLLTCLKTCKRVLGIKKIGLKNHLLTANSKSTPRSPIEENTKKDIISVYKKEIESLQNLTGRDLSSWFQ